jgi:K+-transporting ATPase KdpC subunit
MRSAIFGRHLITSVVMFIGLTVVLGFGYPLVVTGLSQLFFHKQANGSLIYRDGKLVGSELLGQEFTDSKGNPLPRYFQPRPSAAGAGYDGASSGASNLGPSNPLLIGFVAGVNTIGLNGRPSATNPFATRPIRRACPSPRREPR